MTLSNQLVVDMATPATYMTSLSLGFIPAGTTVRSYMIHADPVGSPDNDQSFGGSVRFSKDIVGIISTTGNLDATDWVSRASTPVNET